MDVDSTISYLKTNPFLVTVIVGGAALVGKRLLATAYAWAKQHASSYVTLYSTYGNDVKRMAYILQQHRVGVLSRNYSVDERKRLSIGYGMGLAKWRGTYVVFNMTLEKLAYSFQEVLYLQFLTRDASVIQSLVDEATDENRDRNYYEVHRPADGCWSATGKRRKRLPETVFSNADTWTRLNNKLDQFRDREDWYVSRGIGYKLVVLLYGEPGTGKSSMIQAVASMLNRDLYCVGSLTSLARMAGKVPENGILVIEDIDTLGTSKRAEDESESAPTPSESAAASHAVHEMPRSLTLLLEGPNVELHGLLQTLDGLDTPHGMIVFITTNFRSRLDAALLRPGRIDLSIEMARLDYDAYVRMHSAFYGSTDCLLSVAEYEPQTGAYLQELFSSTASHEAMQRLLDSRASTSARG